MSFSAVRYETWCSAHLSEFANGVRDAKAAASARHPRASLIVMLTVRYEKRAPVPGYRELTLTPTRKDPVS